MNASTQTRLRLLLVVLGAFAVALTLALVHANAASAAAPVGDTQVNNSTGDTPENTTQSETSIAVRGTTLCAGFNDSGGAGLSGFARSTNSGQTWTDRGSLGAGNNGDPVIAVNSTNGNFYYAENATVGGNPAIGVAVSTDDCLNFGATIDASAASSGNSTATDTTTLSDKPSIAVDNTGGANNGNIYVCWTRFFDTNGDGNADSSELRFSRSTNNGANYGNEQILQANGTAPFGCTAEVSPNGQVDVFWADRVGATAGDIRFRSSTDGGVNFGGVVQVSTGNRLPGTDRVVACGATNRTTLNGNIRMLHQAWSAVDTTGGASNGNLYAVWVSDPTDSGGSTDHGDVFFSRSTNGGANWSAPLQLGGGTVTDQFEPNVAVGGDGAVSVMWYDRRNDTANNLSIDVYKAFSTDGGQTFGALQRVTNQSFGVPQLSPNFDNRIATCYMGEYIAVAADAESFYYIWGDNRNTVTSTNWPAGRPDPDVWFESEVSPDQGINASGTTFASVEGSSFTGTVATFYDGNASGTAADYSASIDWGDGNTSAGTISGPTGGPFTVTGTHTYIEEGTYAVKVTITEVGDPSNTATANSTANVADAPIHASCAAPSAIPQSYTGPVAKVTDENPFAPVIDFSATVNWGDGATTAGIVTGPIGGPFTVSGTHTYGSTGFFTIATKVDDIGGSTDSTSCNVVVFGTSAGGNFVIGNGNSAIGTNVTFWGSQWAKQNTLSGGAAPAPAAFKGFSNTPNAAPSCGTNWSTGPGNSAAPPKPPLPAFMAVIVASSISKSGSTISGNTQRVVVVQTNPGYNANPGHAGTGKVVAVVC